MTRTRFPCIAPNRTVRALASAAALAFAFVVTGWLAGLELKRRGR